MSKKVLKFGRNNNGKDKSSEPEGLKFPEKYGDHREFYYLGLSWRYKKGGQFCSRYMKGVPFW